MHKVVIDTNLLVNGAVDDYNFGNRIVDAVIAEKIAAFANRATLRENQLIVDQKVRDSEYREKMQQFFGKIHRVGPLEKKLAVVEDPQDNKLLESAVAAGADFLISADSHLLKLGEYEGVKIVTPEAFWTIFEEEKGTAWKQWLTQFVK